MLRSVNYLCDHLAADCSKEYPELETNPVIQFAKEHHIVQAAWWRLQGKSNEEDAGQT